MAKQDEADIRLKVGFLSHPKTMRVRRALGAEGVLALIQLLMFVRVNCHKDGALRGLTDEDIEGVAGWPGCESHAPGMLAACLSDAGFLEGEIGARTVHEWKQHQPFAATFTKRSKAGRIAASARWDKSSASSKRNASRIRAACDPHAKGNAPSPVPAHYGRNRGADATDAPSGAPGVAPDVMRTVEIPPDVARLAAETGADPMTILQTRAYQARQVELRAKRAGGAS